MADELLIGAHMSAAGGAFNALTRGHEIGATTIQIFTANQKTWKPKPLEQEAIDKWFELRDEMGIRDIMSHDSYLINLGSPKDEVLGKSRIAFRQEIERCLALDIRYLNFHPGAALDGTVEECLDLICESLVGCAPMLDGKNTTLLLEATAGQGSVVGWRFEELGYIIGKVKDQLPIGVCIDTCHIFAAGYDVSSKQGWDATLEDFDKAVGLKYLRALHVNDSQKPLGSRRDRHANLGEGEIGIDGFKAMMQHPAMRSLPKYLETPNGEERWADEIQLLRKFAG